MEDLLGRYAYECIECGFETQLITAMRNIKHGNHVRLTYICHHCGLKDMDETTLARLENHLIHKKKDFSFSFLKLILKSCEILVKMT